MYPAYPAPSARAVELHARLVEFMADEVFPGEEAYDAYREQAGPHDHTVPPVVEELKARARGPGAVEPLPARGVRADPAGVRPPRGADRLVA
jgi:hypothetical protein